MLPVALFDDGGVALDADGIGGFGRHGDVVVGMLTGLQGWRLRVVVEVTADSAQGTAVDFRTRGFGYAA